MKYDYKHFSILLINIQIYINYVDFLVPLNLFIEGAAVVNENNLS